MNMTPLISVLIPVYNTSADLQKCLDSIIHQTYSNLEIIAINDGSSDDSLKILKQYAESDQRFVIIDQENQGVSKTRNVALNHAKGEYVLWVDSDDWIELNTCEFAVEEMLREEADVVFWSYFKEYSGNSIVNFVVGENKVCWDKENVHQLFQRLVGLTSKELNEPHKIDALSPLWGKLYRRSLMEDLSFVDLKDIGTGEDTLFNVQYFSKVNKAVYLPNAFYHYRKTSLSTITRSYKKDLVLKWCELHRLIKENVPESCDHALSNRIALGLIGLGLNLAEDTKLSFFEKRNELKRILKMKQYQESLAELEMHELPLKWRVFFFCAKYQMITALCALLYLMNTLRGK